MIALCIIDIIYIKEAKTRILVNSYEIMNYYISSVSLLLLSLSIYCSTAIDLSINNSESLQYYLCNGVIETGTTLSLSSNIKHVINQKESVGPCLVQSLANITIRGEGGTATVQCTGNNNTFAFINVTNLWITNIHFSGCGGSLGTEARQYLTENIAPLLYTPTATVLTIANTNGLNIEGIMIDGGYYGYGLMAINPNNNTRIRGLIIQDNNKNDSNNCTGGSGLMIVINEHYHTNNITLDSVLIMNNINGEVHAINPIDMLRHNYKSVQLFGGGGLTILAITYKQLVINMNNVLINNNKGNVVGGVLLLISAGEGAINIIMTSSSVSQNNLTRNRKGGGIGIFIIRPLTNKQQNINNNNINITLSNTTLSGNIGASFGGGMFIGYPNYMSGNALVILKDCLVIQNMASRQGHAIYVTSDSTDIEEISKYNISILLEDSVIVRNGEGMSPFNLDGHHHTYDEWDLLKRSTMKFVRANNLIIRGTGKQRGQWGEGKFIIQENTGSGIALTNTNITLTGFIRIR